MEPNNHEIEQVGEALVSLNQFEYTAEQIDILNPFLQAYGLEYDQAELEDAFQEHPEILSAIQTLHNFSTKYKDNNEITEEIKIEFDDILYNLNDSSNNITF